MKIRVYLRNAVADFLMGLSIKIRPLPWIRSVKVEGLDVDRVMTEEKYKMGGPYFPEEDSG